MDFSSRNQRVTALVFFIIISVFTDYILAGPYHFISVLVPSIGLILIYHMFYKQHTNITLLTYFIAFFVSRFFFTNEALWFAFIVSIYKTFIVFIMMVLMDHLLHYLTDHGYTDMNRKDILNYVFIGIFVSLMGASLHLFPIYFLYDYDLDMFWYGNTLIGYMFGFFIFGSAFHFSLLHDDKLIQRKSFYYSLLYIVLLGIVSLMIFSEVISSFNFYNFSYLFFVIYAIGSVFLEFRIIFLSNYIVLSSYSIFKFNHYAEFDLSTELFSIILLLLILTGFSVFVKYAFLRIIRKEVETEKLKNSIKDMMYETSHILKNVEEISSASKTYSNDFLIKMFRMGCNVLEKYDMASIFIREEGHIKYIDSIGYDINYLNSLDLLEEKFDWSFIKPGIVEEDDKVYAKDFKENTEYFEKYPPIKQSIRFTIMFDDKPVAGMSFDITEKNLNTFTKEDLDNYKELSQMINSFYDLVVIQDSNNSFRNDIVISLVRALGLYDVYTGRHSEEVAFLALEISRKLKLSNKRTQRIYWSAIVHDIGKIGVSAETISKKGLLTPIEREEVEKHSVFGYNILNSVEGLKDVAHRVRHHHERWDGTGYPDGLKGKEIPLCSQVLAVCDAVSAMSRSRTYSSAKTIDEILLELQNERGKQFSPLVADAMIEYIKESNLVKYFIETS